MSGVASGAGARATMRAATALLLAGAGLASSGCVVWDIRDEMRRTNAQVASANQQIGATNEQIDATNEQLDQVTTTLDELQKTNASLARVEQQLTALQQRLQVLDQMQTSLASLDTSLLALRKTLENIDSTIPFLGLTSGAPKTDDQPAPAAAPSPQPAGVATPPADAPAASPPAGDQPPGDQPSAPADPNAPPPNVTRMMSRLTVPNRYDPASGNIVALEVVELPAALRESLPLGEAVERARTEGKPLLVFTTADRCAVCQQFKKDAMSDPRLAAFLRQGRVVATHVEVDRQGDEAQRVLGSRAIPMTYWLVDGQVVGTLRGNRPADELLAFIRDRLPAR